MKRLLLISLFSYAPLHSAAAATSIVPPRSSLLEIGHISARIIAQTARALVLQGLTLSTFSPRTSFTAPCDAGVTLSIEPHGRHELRITAVAFGSGHWPHSFTSLGTEIYDAIIATRITSTRSEYNYFDDNHPNDLFLRVDGNSKILGFKITTSDPKWIATVRTQIYRKKFQEVVHRYIQQLPNELKPNESKEDSKISVTPPSAPALPMHVATATPLATPSAPPAPPV